MSFQTTFKGPPSWTKSNIRHKDLRLSVRPSPFVCLSYSGDTPWVLKRGGLETSGWRLSKTKTKRHLFNLFIRRRKKILLIFWKKKKAFALLKIYLLVFVQSRTVFLTQGHQHLVYYLKATALTSYMPKCADIIEPPVPETACILWQFLAIGTQKFWVSVGRIVGNRWQILSTRMALFRNWISFWIPPC